MRIYMYAVNSVASNGRRDKRRLVSHALTICHRQLVRNTTWLVNFIKWAFDTDYDPGNLKPRLRKLVLSTTVVQVWPEAKVVVGRGLKYLYDTLEAPCLSTSSTRLTEYPSFGILDPQRDQKVVLLVLLACCVIGAVKWLVSLMARRQTIRTFACPEATESNQASVGPSSSQHSKVGYRISAKPTS